MRPKHEVLTRISLLRMELKSLEKACDRLPDEVDNDSHEAEECKDFFVPESQQLVDDVIALRARIIRWNPSQQERDIQALEQEKRLRDRAGLTIVK